MHGPSGFVSSNVSKGLLLTIGIFSLVAQLTKSTSLFTLDLSLIGRGQAWRLLTHNFVWGSSSELVLGSVLLYTWRMFERQFGSRKFAGCAIFLLFASTLLQVVVLLISRAASPKDWAFSSGPYGLAFGLLAMFFFDIPQSTPFKLFGLPLSDKFFIYLLGVQLALSAIPGSGYTALIGLALGILYRLEFLPFHRIRVPEFLARICDTLFTPLLSGSLFATLLGLQRNPQAQQRNWGGGGRVGGSGARGVMSPPPAAANDAAYGGPGGVQGGSSNGGYAMVDDEPQGEVLAGGGGGFYAAAAPAAAVDPAAVAQLTAMGFSEERARAALRMTNNDLTAATNQLLGS